VTPLVPAQETAVTVMPRRPIRRPGRVFIAVLFAGGVLAAPSAALAGEPFATTDAAAETEAVPAEALTPPPTDAVAQGDATSDPTTVLLFLGALALGAGLSADRARAKARA
jgi:hypothetical protein